MSDNDLEQSDAQDGDDPSVVKARLAAEACATSYESTVSSGVEHFARTETYKLGWIQKFVGGKSVTEHVAGRRQFAIRQSRIWRWRFGGAIVLVISAALIWFVVEEVGKKTDTTKPKYDHPRPPHKVGSEPIQEHPEQIPPDELREGGELPPDPYNASVLTKEAHRLGDKREYEKACEKLKLAEELDPGKAKYAALMCWMWYQKGDFESAANSCRRALQIDDKEITARNNLGLILMRENAYGEALQHFQAAVAQNPWPSHYYQLARAQARTQDLQGAVDSLRKACVDESWRKKAESEADFESLRPRPDFRGIVFTR